MPHIAVPVALWEQTNKAFLPPGFLLLASAPFREKQRAGSLLLHHHQHPPGRLTWPQLRGTHAWDDRWGCSGVSWGFPSCCGHRRHSTCSPPRCWCYFGVGEPRETALPPPRGATMGTRPGVGLNGSAILGMFPFPLLGLFLEAEWVPKGPGYGVDKGADDILVLVLQPQKPCRKEGRPWEQQRSLQKPPGSSSHRGWFSLGIPCDVALLGSTCRRGSVRGRWDPPGTGRGCLVTLQGSASHAPAGLFAQSFLLCTGDRGPVVQAGAFRGGGAKLRGGGQTRAHADVARCPRSR